MVRPLIMYGIVMCIFVCTGDLQGRNHDIDHLRVINAKYKTACGPIACYIALKYLGVETVNIQSMAEKCRWTQEKGSSLKDLVGGLRECSDDVTVSARTASPEDLCAVVSNNEAVAILPVRRGSDALNHAICVLHCDADGFHTLDYPELGKTLDTPTLASIWDGQVIVISRKDDFLNATNGTLLLLPVLSLAIMLVYYRTKQHNRDPAA